MKSGEEHVLIVDDFKDTRELYGCFLPLRGFPVSLASNGQEALDVAFADPPDLIIMDLSMPVMNGWEATRRLKADPRTRHVPVVMLTATPMNGLTPMLVEAGFDAVLVKPCMPDEVVAEIRRVLDARPHRETQKPARRRAAQAHENLSPRQ